MAGNKAAAIKCKRCGKCCYVYNKGQWETCRYLKFIGQKAFCRIYKKRLGQKVGKNQICISRNDTPFDYPDCPYNSGKPIHPLFLYMNKSLITKEMGVKNCVDEDIVEDAEFMPAPPQDDLTEGQDRKRIISGLDGEEVGVKKVCLD